MIQDEMLIYAFEERLLVIFKKSQAANISPFRPQEGTLNAGKVIFLHFFIIKEQKCQAQSDF